MSSPAGLEKVMWPVLSVSSIFRRLETKWVIKE